MNKHQPPTAQSGFTLLWLFVWIAGMSSIAWATVVYAMPQFEKKQRSAVVRTVSKLSETPLSVKFDGFTATVSGSVPDQETKNNIIEALDFRKGVIVVHDKLSVLPEAIEPPPAISLPSFDKLVAAITQGAQRPSVDIPFNHPDSISHSTTRLQSLSTNSQLQATASSATAATTEPQSTELPDARNDINDDLTLSDDDNDAEAIDDAAVIETETDMIASSIAEPDQQLTETATAQADQTEEVALEFAENTAVVASQPDTNQASNAEKMANILLAKAALALEPEATEVATANPKDIKTVVLEPEDAGTDGIKPNSTQTPTKPYTKSTTPAQAKQSLQQALNKLESTKITFESSSDILTTDSQSRVDDIAEVFMAFPDTTVSIEGHTDATGENEINLALSLARAVAVRSRLIEQGVSVHKLRAKGFGEEMPITSNESAEGRAANRRIEFKF